MQKYTFPHRCIGDSVAAYVCISPQCFFKCPLLCQNYLKCHCREHYHKNPEFLMKFEDFINKVESAEPQSVLALRRRLLAGLVDLRNDMAKVFADQQNKINEFAEKISKLYCKDIVLIKSYKDIELRTGKELKELLTTQPKAQGSLPPVLLNKVQQSIKTLQLAYTQFKEALEQYAPVVQGGPIGSIQAKINGTNQLVYENESAPLKEILSPEFSKIQALICDHAIADLRLVDYFRTFSSQTLKILSLKDNNLGDAQVDAIVRAQLPNLIEFKACGNIISDVGAGRIAEANWPKLGYFNLHSNHITSEGARKLIKRYSAVLWRFDLDFNVLQDDLLKDITNAKWDKLTEVHLGGNQFSEGVKGKLETFFKCDVKAKKVFILVPY